MPFTPFHFGPPLLSIGIWRIIDPKAKGREHHLYFLILLYGAVIPDIQGFYSLFFASSVPLHGFSHTIVGAGVYSLLTIFGLQIASKLLQQELQIKSIRNIYLLIFFSILAFHFIPDMFIWSDMHIFAPFSTVTFGVESNYRLIANILGTSILIGLLVNIVISLKHSLE